MAFAPPRVLIKRTITPNSPPTALMPGELACELATPTRLWIGVPQDLDSLGRKLLIDTSSTEGAVHISPDQPTNPINGMLWFESDTGMLWLYYDDGTSLQWIQMNGGSDGSEGGGISQPEADSLYVKLAGDTMTGPLTSTGFNSVNGNIRNLYGRNGAQARWSIKLGDAAPESTANAGSDFALSRYDDAGVAIGDVLKIARADGHMVLDSAAGLTIKSGTGTGGLELKNVNPTITLNKTGVNQYNSLIAKHSDVTRWIINLGDAVPESGGNVGSDISISRFSDTGTVIGNEAVFRIERGNGNVQVNAGLAVSDLSGSATVAANGCALGLNFNGAATGGIYTRPRASGSAYVMTIWNSAAAIVGSISHNDTTTVFGTSSDERLKEDAQTFDAGPIIDAINVYNFAWKLDGSREYGVIAQQAVDVFPQAIIHNEALDWWGVDYSKFVPLLLQEMKALRERVAYLETLVPQPKA